MSDFARPVNPHRLFPLTRLYPGWTGRTLFTLDLERLESRNAPAGVWTALANPVPSGGVGTMLLLSDGTVMVQGSGIAGPDEGLAAWYRLTPDATGSYVNGSWSALASMGLAREFFAADVLPDGRVFVLGGEYSKDPAAPGSLPRTFVNSGQIYNPVSNTWADIAPFPQPEFGDDPSEVLPDGRVLAGNPSGPQTYAYDSSTDAWSAEATKLRSDRSHEETWVKLADGSILSYDVNPSPGAAQDRAQRYVPSTGVWVDAGAVPASLSSYDELGPAFLLPDGRAIFFGDNGATAYYSPGTDSWAKGPPLPDVTGASDVPGAELPDGTILIAVGQDPHDGGVNAPTSVFEFDPTSGSYTDVTPSSSQGTSTTGKATIGNMLLLPSGQVLLSTGATHLSVYTPDGAAGPSRVPTITSVEPDGGNTFTLTGTGLNGGSEGASFGDDAQMASNYPLVRLTDGAGSVHYARTFKWTNTGVATGTAPESVQFTVPPGVPDQEQLVVVANGVASTPVAFDAGATVNINPVFPIQLPSPPPPAAVPYAVGTGPGAVAEVKVFDSSGKELRDFFPYGLSFQGGVQVAVADFTGAGDYKVITGAGPGGGLRVEVFDVATGALQANFFAFEPDFTGGVSIANGDLGGGISPVIVVGTGFGGGPRIEVLDAFHLTDVSQNGELPSDAVLSDFFAFEPSFRGGVNVAVDGGYVIAGAGIGRGPRVTVFDAATQQPVQSFFAYGSNYWVQHAQCSLLK